MTMQSDEYQHREQGGTGDYTRSISQNKALKSNPDGGKERHSKCQDGCNEKGDEWQEMRLQRGLGMWEPWLGQGVPP